MSVFEASLASANVIDVFWLVGYFFFFPRLTQTHFLIRRHCFDESSR